MLYQVRKIQGTNVNQTDEIESNLELLTKAIRNPSDINADRIIIPFLQNGISLTVDTSSHYLIDHFINVPLEMEIVSRHPQIELNENSIGTKLTITWIHTYLEK